MSYINDKGQLITTPTIVHDRYVVYFHINKKTRNVFYIGEGKNERPFERGRSAKWHEYTKFNDYEVLVVATNLSKEDAGELERKLISQYRPLGFLVNGERGNKPKPVKVKAPSRKEILINDFFKKVEKDSPTISRLQIVEYNKNNFDNTIFKGYCWQHHYAFETRVFLTGSTPCRYCNRVRYSYEDEPVLLDDYLIGL